MTPLVIGVACEDNGHFFVVSRLVDAALVAQHTWLDGILEECRSWRGLTHDRPWYKYDPEDASHYPWRPRSPRNRSRTSRVAWGMTTTCACGTHSPPRVIFIVASVYVSTTASLGRRK